MACMKKALPFILMVLLQIGYAGMDILTKDVLNKGMSIYVLSVYRHGVATVVMAPFAFYFDNPVIAQNLFNLGMKYTTATFAIALYNTLPAVTFILALIFRLESVKFQSIRSAAKVVGTVTTVGGIMVMTLVKGPALDLFWTKGPSAQNTVGTDIHSSIKGAVLVTIGCFSYACFMILQAITLKTYPAELSLATWICLIGTIEGVVVALVMEKGNPSVWAIGWDTKLLTITYSGIVCSALGYYIGGVVMKTRGPVFVTAFKPLCMIVVAIMSSIIFDEQMYLGRALGATVICVGLLQSQISSHTEENNQVNAMFQSTIMEEGCNCVYSRMASKFSIGLLIILAIVLLMVRVLYVIYRCGKPLPKGASQSFTTLIVLGSGGHTAEMLSLLSVLRKDRFTPRFYIAAATDNMSLQKARSFEDSLAEKPAVKEASSQFMQIYRSREVGQSYVTSVWTTIVAILHALWLMIRIRPQVILCNGPGTCIPLCVIAFLFKVLGIRWSSIFYVESVARVKKLSLSGLLLYKLRIADQFFVQWPQLHKKYPRAHYVGCLM